MSVFPCEGLAEHKDHPTMRLHRPNLRTSRHGSKSRSSRAPQFANPGLLLASGTGFLQGVVTISGTSQGLAGAKVQLEPAQPAVVQTLTTDSTGVYLFQGLASGEYRIVETPPARYLNDESQPDSPLTPVVAHTSSSIDVQLGDPTQLLLNYPSHNKEELYVTNNGQTHNSLVGQLNLSITQPDINDTSPLFPSFCVDFFRDIDTGDQNLPIPWSR